MSKKVFGSFSFSFKHFLPDPNANPLKVILAIFRVRMIIICLISVFWGLFLVIFAHLNDLCRLFCFLEGCWSVVLLTNNIAVFTRSYSGPSIRLAVCGW